MRFLTTEQIADGFDSLKLVVEIRLETVSLPIPLADYARSECRISVDCGQIAFFKRVVNESAVAENASRAPRRGQAPCAKR